MKMSNFAEKLKDNAGYLNKNQKKTDSKHPDWKGYVRIKTGELMQIAAWENDGNGTKYFSLRITEIKEDYKQKPEIVVEKKPETKFEPIWADTMPF
jgi:hypothetical protein